MHALPVRPLRVVLSYNDLRLKLLAAESGALYPSSYLQFRPSVVPYGLERL